MSSTQYNISEEEQIKSKLRKCFNNKYTALVSYYICISRVVYDLKLTYKDFPDCDEKIVRHHFDKYEKYERFKKKYPILHKLKCWFILNFC